MSFLKYFKTYRKTTLTTGLIFGIFIIFEIININSDIYNFNQVSKMKNYLGGISKSSYHFRSLKEFNSTLNLNIQPKGNCYFVVDTVNYKGYENKESPGYIIGFALESLLMKLYYGEGYYVYPKYDLPKTTMCTNNYCYDSTFFWFLRTVETPCEK